MAGQPQQILASGRVSQDLPGWLQLLADVLDAPVVPVTTKRATLRGTALLALDVLAPDVTRAPSPTGTPLTPVAGRQAYHRERRAQFQQLYTRTIAADA